MSIITYLKNLTVYISTLRRQLMQGIHNEQDLYILAEDNSI